MTKKDKVKDTDLKKVAGGRGASPKGQSFGDDALPPPDEHKSQRQPLTPDQAASVSGGRSSQPQAQPGAPSMESDDPPSIRFSPDNPSPSDK